MKKIIFFASLIFAATSVLFAHGPVHEQIDRLNKQIKKDSLNPALYLERGVLFKIDEDIDQSIRDFKKVLSIDETIYSAYFQLAELYTEKELYLTAQNLIDFYLSQHPQHANAVALQGRIYENLNQDSTALNSFAKVVAIKGSKAQPVDYIDWAYTQSKFNYLQAITILENGMRVIGEAASLQTTLIDIAVKYEWYERAIQQIDNLIAKQQRKEAWLLKKAAILKKMGDPQQAIKYYQFCLAEIETLKPKIKNTTYVQATKSKAEKSLQCIHSSIRK